MKNVKLKRYLTPTEVAEMLRVSPITVRQWAQKGELLAELTPGGHRRFLASVVEDFARARKLTLASRSGQPTKILIVEDDLWFARYLADLLEGSPVSAITASARDGFQAGRMVHTFRPDIVLLDLRMPGLDGIQVCQQIKADPSLAGVRVIAMSGYTSAEQTRHALAAGAERCLTKPLDAKELMEALHLPETSDHPRQSTSDAKQSG